MIFRFSIMSQVTLKPGSSHFAFEARGRSVLAPVCLLGRDAGEVSEEDIALTWGPVMAHF